MGEFEIINVKKAKRILETLSKVLTLFTPKTKINKRIVVAEIARFLMVNDDYNETALLQFVMENKVTLINESNNSEQIASLLQQGLYESFDLK